jgi:hypothetical protein
MRRPPLAIAVHDLHQARAALAAAEAMALCLRLWTVPGAAAYAGVGYLHALGEELGVAVVIDCGDDAGAVMAALRIGAREVAFTGDDAVARKLLDMAEQQGARLWTERPAGLVVLDPDEDPRPRLAGPAGAC